jgi:hypothetical protein
LHCCHPVTPPFHCPEASLLFDTILHPIGIEVHFLINYTDHQDFEVSNVLKSAFVLPLLFWGMIA